MGEAAEEAGGGEPIELVVVAVVACEGGDSAFFEFEGGEVVGDSEEEADQVAEVGVMADDDEGGLGVGVEPFEDGAGGGAGAEDIGVFQAMLEAEDFGENFGGATGSGEGAGEDEVGLDDEVFQASGDLADACFAFGEEGAVVVEQAGGAGVDGDSVAEEIAMVHVMALGGNVKCLRVDVSMMLLPRRPSGG